MASPVFRATWAEDTEQPLHLWELLRFKQIQLSQGASSLISPHHQEGGSRSGCGCPCT